MFDQLFVRSEALTRQLSAPLVDERRQYLTHVVLGYRSRASVARPHPQRHITPSATEEILCGGPHKISQTHSFPSGNFDTERHSMGSMNDASVFGNESRRTLISFRTMLRVE